MSAIVIDTHILLWYLFDPAKLSPAALKAIMQAESDGSPIYVASISVVELRYLVEKKKFSEAQYQVAVDTLNDPVQLTTTAPLDPGVADQLKNIPRPTVHRMP